MIAHLTLSPGPSAGGSNPPLRANDVSRSLRRTFEERVCIVTGGASGLGKELCRQLSAAGAWVTLADIDEAKIHAAVVDFAAPKTAINAKIVDVTDARSVQSLIEGVSSKFGRIDYLFNNAGSATWGEVRDLTLEHWRESIEVNLMGVVNGIHHAYPIMLRQGFGHIVNVASGFGIVPTPLCAPYVAAKYAVFGLSNSMRMETRGSGVNVTVVCPGFVKTEMANTMNAVNATAASVLAAMPIPVRMMDVRHAVERILSGVARNKGIIIFPAHIRIFEFAFRIVPRLFIWFGSKFVAEFRKIKQPARNE